MAVEEKDETWRNRSFERKRENQRESEKS